MTHDYSITFLSARQSSSCLKLQCSPVSQNQRWFMTFLLPTKPVLFSGYTLHDTAYHCFTTLAIIKQRSYGMVVGLRLQLFGKMRHSEHISYSIVSRYIKLLFHSLLSLSLLSLPLISSIIYVQILCRTNRSIPQI